MRRTISTIESEYYRLISMTRCEDFDVIEFLRMIMNMISITQRFLDVEQSKIRKWLLSRKQELQWEMLWIECAMCYSKIYTLQ